MYEYCIGVYHLTENCNMAAFLFKQEVFKNDAHIEKVLKKLLTVACDVISQIKLYSILESF